MAQDEDAKKPIKDISSDSGLGNLPPLSDFDSQGGLGSDGGLPPLGSFDSESVGTPSEHDGELPAISDIDVETPNPAGGSAGGFGSNVNDTFSSGSPLDTPGPGSQGGAGFQDLAADSDFSPETPEIGPGPDSNVDTPMFDSAFGGGDGGFSAGLDTPSPTQAMETPMFGGDALGGGGGAVGGGGGFDPGGFGGFDAGTPPPDFSPDTDVHAMNTTGAGVAPPPKRGGGAGIAIAGVAALLIGIVAGPFIESYLPIPTPLKGEVQSLQTQNATLKSDNQRLSNLTQSGNVKTISREEVQNLTAELEKINAELTDKQPQLESLNDDISASSFELDELNGDLAEATEKFVEAQNLYDNLVNETAIIQARQRGLIAEVDRLTGHVGDLEDANTRRIASKEALGHAIDRLYVQVSEGIPLTPEKYNHAARVAAVESLRDDLGESNWVTPALMDNYTDLYLKELAVAAGEEYFFARLTVRDEFGNLSKKWAECLMRGNWAVYYRTLDGKNVGVYKNLSDGDTPHWGYVQDLPAGTRSEVEEMVFASRVDGFEEKVLALAEKEVALQSETPWQRAYGSL